MDFLNFRKWNRFHPEKKNHVLQCAVLDKFQKQDESIFK